MNNIKDRKILILMITCSLSKVRNRIEVECVKNLVTHWQPLQNEVDILFFDNGSTYEDHLNCLYSVEGVRVVKSSVNRGLWSALDWVLTSSEDYMNKKYQSIYVVESDLLHNTLQPLVEISDYLHETRAFAMVRTETFSIRQRWRFDKRWSFLPYPLHQSESAVHLRNQVTGQRAYFREANGLLDLYASNWHAKVPGLHRFQDLRKVFQKLYATKTFQESDFFRRYHDLCSEVLVLDKGLWKSITSPRRFAEETSSWGNAKKREDEGYLPTRQASISRYMRSEIVDLSS
jgi:hypothetical protein